MCTKKLKAKMDPIPASFLEGQLTMAEVGCPMGKDQMAEEGFNRAWFFIALHSGQSLKLIAGPKGQKCHLSIR